MKIMRKIIEIDEEKCDGCGNCVPSCAEGAIEIIDGKAKVVKDQYCDGLGACMGECPQGALTLVEREADAFDEEAVEAFLKSKDKNSAPASSGCGCPSETLHTFSTLDESACQTANKPVIMGESASALGHWPVQIRLVPPTAPFLKDADLLVTADCVPIAYGSFHQDFLKDKVVMMGCPKFDDKDAYVEKFTQIFAGNTIKSITVLIMEVPCCSGLPGILERAMALADKKIPMTKTVISARGEIVKPNKINAGTIV
ncbi:ferredoxin (4Fe-4S iron-sulfur cluster binding protein) [Desulforapulum autotrophicum HRM2]|uniref:Ferredoxin (4Fe-4S iron-sulfur cluster binding protein) n=1 Tax=Desulforapulum autotrophicum (strain ATCC 43914 / DSM 3382 / VKM B-1955 / HRM2) TaxID=177437 RepID=C0QCA2_DESAH|nr:4Fe-4S binding protein [Desulforapulum autotrophicum]ACN17119.1 ferredoxin (4Fe-4S iron-sulfur cluster binding protein) [Desulforapulum autotrophicum HRM2]